MGRSAYNLGKMAITPIVHVQNKQKFKTYNTGDSLVVTHLNTNPAIIGYIYPAKGDCFLDNL